MNYYPYHIGDFRSGTINMSRQARWIYRDMLDVYYDTESPLPLDLDVLCDMLGVETEDETRIVERLLRFKFDKAEDGYRNSRCDKEIASYRAKAETAKANGKRGGRPRKADGNPEKPIGFQSGSNSDATRKQEETGSKTNQEPRTKNHKDTSLRSVSGAEPSVESSDPPIISLPTNRHESAGESAVIRQSQIDIWVEAFPAVDVIAQLKQIKSWLVSNPSKRKTLGGMPRFVNTWLSREQDKGGSSRGTNQRSDQPYSAVDKVKYAIDERAREREEALQSGRAFIDENGDFVDSDGGDLRGEVGKGLRHGADRWVGTVLEGDFTRDDPPWPGPHGH